MCNDCGCVQDQVVFFETAYGSRIPTKTSNYKRLHHWHERISQFLLHESPIPNDEMLRIGSRLLDGSYDCVGKDAVREVLRVLGLQRHIERWLQILHRVTGVDEWRRELRHFLLMLQISKCAIQRGLRICSIPCVGLAGHTFSGCVPKTKCPGR